MGTFLVECKKTMKIDGVIAFKAGTIYQWDWATDEELEDGFSEYCFKSELCDKHFLSGYDLEEFF